MPSETLVLGDVIGEYTPKNGEVLAWHFVNSTLRDGRPVPADGVELRHDGPVRMRVSGLHASVRAIDALRYAPGATACRVVMRDVVRVAADKLVARSRTILWRVDATDVLREFARDCALDVLHMWATPETPGIDAVVEYLLTGDESLRDIARTSAWAAWASALAEGHAGDAMDVLLVALAEGHAGDAIGVLLAALAEGDAMDVLLAARAVARDARDAVWDAQNKRLERMLEAAR